MNNETQLMHHDNEGDEISLKELILSIWLQRKLVAGITAVVLLLSAIYAFLILNFA